MRGCAGRRPAAAVPRGHLAHGESLSHGIGPLEQMRFRPTHPPTAQRKRDASAVEKKGAVRHSASAVSLGHRCGFNKR